MTESQETDWTGVGFSRHNVPKARLKRILVTGGRFFTGYNLIRSFLETHGPGVVVHGACYPAPNPDGTMPLCSADWLAHLAAGVLGYPDEPHPADWDSSHRHAGTIRNQAMVDLGADVAGAFPGPKSRGTWDCVRRLRAAGIYTIVHPVETPPKLPAAH